MGPPRGWGNSLELHHTFLSVLASQHTCTDYAGSSLAEPVFPGWILPLGGRRNWRRRGDKSGTRKYFKQEKPHRSILCGPVKLQIRSSRRLRWGSNLLQLPMIQFQDLFLKALVVGTNMSLTSEGQIPCKNSTGFPLILGALAKQPLIWLPPQVLLRYLCSTPARVAPRAGRGRSQKWGGPALQQLCSEWNGS